MGKKLGYKFTAIPYKNDEFFKKNTKFGLLHLYLTERVRGFEASGQVCYMTNEQFGHEINASISTIKRALQLLIKNKVLYASYQNGNKQRKLYIYSEEIEKSKNQKDNKDSENNNANQEDNLDNL